MWLIVLNKFYLAVSFLIKIIYIYVLMLLKLFLSPLIKKKVNLFDSQIKKNKRKLSEMKDKEASSVVSLCRVCVVGVRQTNK